MATLAEQIAAAAAELALWQGALEAILSGAQSYTIAGRSLTRGDLAVIKAGRDEAQRALDRLNAGAGRGPSLMRVMPRDF